MVGVRRRPPGSPGPGEPGPTQSGGQDPWQAYGGGERDPHSGLYEWYEPPEAEKATQTGPPITWHDLVSRWWLVEADLQDTGVDIEDKRLMRLRSWRWLEVRILGLLHADTRIARALADDRQQA